MSTPITQELLENKLAEAKKKRDEFVDKANREVAFLNGTIAMMEELISPPTPPKDTD